MMLATDALDNKCQQDPSRKVTADCFAYKAPRAKIPETWILRVLVMLSLHTNGIGRNKSMTSVTTACTP